ncbi:MAG: squalene synthase HpnC, partial [Calditrichaeota bacterium]
RKNKTPEDLNEAYNYCQKITRDHYENFPVASLLVPRRLQKHISAIYAFARTADDFADEEQNRNKLIEWRKQLHSCLNEPASNPIFLALANTIEIFEIPVQWLDDLLTAFLLDLDKNRFHTLNDLEDYCHYSAHPVGRIVLWIFGYRDEELMTKSDYVTSALQLTNFWQDISIDLKRDKIYIPLDLLAKYKISEQGILNQKVTPNFALLIEELSRYTQNLYDKGKSLAGSVRGRLRFELQFTAGGGREILRKVHKYRTELIHYRPVLTKRDWIRLALKMITRTS